jgi:hypothetical protein
MQEQMVQKDTRQQSHCRSAYQFVSVSVLVPCEQFEKKRRYLFSASD